METGAEETVALMLAALWTVDGVRLETRIFRHIRAIRLAVRKETAPRPL